jgi:hypothetical protein
MAGNGTRYIPMMGIRSWTGRGSARKGSRPGMGRRERKRQAGSLASDVTYVTGTA